MLERVRVGLLTDFEPSISFFLKIEKGGPQAECGAKQGGPNCNAYNVMVFKATTKKVGIEMLHEVEVMRLSDRC